MNDVTVSNALDPQVMAATTIHAQPGVYALLLGSGISTGAGIPTGWGVVQELVRRAAAAQDPDNNKAPQVAFDDPEDWWANHGDGQPLGYSNLLASMAPTPAARRALLAGFFEPSEEEVEAGLKVPSTAHRAIAGLVKRGSVRVILTTNFDRLIERALEDVGISPQIISNTGALVGMSPLQHAPATVIKLHGDYADLLQRNTVDELTTYPEEWNGLLDRVLNEYGLLISGWSADWDHALVAALERVVVRRYPLYWDIRSSKGETAKRLLAQQAGIVLPGTDADELFVGVGARLDALDRLSEPPLTTALAIQRLKRYLPDERRRIDLHDLVMNEVTRATSQIAGFPQHLTGNFPEEVDQLIDRAEALVAPVARMTVVGIQHDIDHRFSGLWVDVLNRLLNAPKRVDGTFQEAVVGIHRFPALLFLRVAGIACLQHGHDDLLVDLLTKPTWRQQFSNDEDLIAAHGLADYRVLDGELVNSLPRYSSRWIYPPSRLLRDAARPVLEELLPREDLYRNAHDDLEYCTALVQRQTGAQWRGPMPGEFIGERGWNRENIPFAEVRFRERAERAAGDWPWFQFVGGKDQFDAVLVALREELKPMTRWG